MASSAHTSRNRTEFTDLPAELILKIMQFTAVDDLPTTVLISKATYEAWKESKQAVFEWILECQYPEFQTCFGKMPGFLTGPAAAIASRRMSMLRTAEQSRNLVTAAWQSVALGIKGSGSVREIEKGGQPFLVMLGRLSRVVDEDLNVLREIPGGREIETGLARRGLLLLWRLRWGAPGMALSRSTSHSPPPGQVRGRIVRQQPETTRRALRDILRLIIMVLIDSPVLREALKLFKGRFPDQMQGLSVVSLQGSDIRKQVVERKVHLLVHLSVNYGIKAMIDLSRLDTEQVTLAEHDRVLRDWAACTLVHFGSSTQPELQQVIQLLLENQAYLNEAIEVEKIVLK